MLRAYAPTRHNYNLLSSLLPSILLYDAAAEYVVTIVYDYGLPACDGALRLIEDDADAGGALVCDSGSGAAI